MDNTVFYHDKDRLRFYSAAHYRKDYNYKQLYKAISMIPADAPVSAQSAVMPHLAYRDKCYQLPIVSDAHFIILAKKDQVTYPQSREDMFKQVADSIASGRWTYLINTEETALLKKIK
jgi:hypothetical protein